MALAVELKAGICEIYTDVDGVFAANPNIVRGAKKIRSISPEMMVKMFKAGAKVMMGRSVRIGQDFNMPIRVMLSPSFGQTDGGTLISRQSREAIENMDASASASLGIKEVSAVTISNIPNRPGIAAEIFFAIKANIIETVQPLSDSCATITIYLDTRNLGRVMENLEHLKTSNGKLEDISIAGFPDLAALTLIDERMVDGQGYAQAMFQCLADRGINISSIYTAEENLGVIIEKGSLQSAAEAIAEKFGLVE